MTDGVREGVQSPRSPRVPSDHSRHDRLLVTRFAANDAYPTEVDEARALVESCTHCAALATDIRLLIKATAELPVPRRQGDFRISHDKAEALRGTWVDRLLRRLTAPSLAPLRPVAGVALSLGIVLAVAGAALPGAPETDSFRLMQVDDYAAPAEATPAPVPAMPEVAPVPDDVDPEGAASAPDDVDPESLEGESVRRTHQEQPPAFDRFTDQATLQASETGNEIMRTVLMYGGMIVALASFTVLLLTAIARRRTRDPLMR